VVSVLQAVNPQGPLGLPGADHPHHALWLLLENVCDPEIPVVSLREMGVLRDIREGPDGLHVIITPTYSGCPAMTQMHDDVQTALAAAGVQAQVLTQLAPAWSSDWLTAEAREKLRRYGIAPPNGSASLHGRHSQRGESSDGVGVVSNVVQFSRHAARPDEVACPQCQSMNTTEVSRFGSTACKAMYRCLDCMEPFDYFKPY
jgi:ring-1,2-phenylacetyl-CoA epoxidase subunit PaaD